MNKYKKELAERRKCGNDKEIKKLPSKTRGHPLLLGDYLDKPGQRVREEPEGSWGCYQFCNCDGCS